MKAEVVSYMLSAENMTRRIEFQLILQCAPFFKGMKTACIVNMEKGACEEIKKLFQGTEIEYFLLGEMKGRCMIFFFRRAVLVSYLMRDEVQEFLEKYGYETENVDRMLEKLSDRICRSIGRRSCFPHEIGVFLDYPVEDVKYFIEEEGRNSLFTGYWKVYTNPEKAGMTFSAYDKAKQSAVNEYLTGMSLQEIIAL